MIIIKSYQNALCLIQLDWNINAALIATLTSPYFTCLLYTSDAADE